MSKKRITRRAATTTSQTKKSLTHRAVGGTASRGITQTSRMERTHGAQQSEEKRTEQSGAHERNDNGKQKRKAGEAWHHG